MTAIAATPALEDQAERLITLGLAERAGLDPDELRRAAAAGGPGDLLVIHPVRLPASALAPFLNLGGKPGFVVEDMVDVDEFAPIKEVVVPADAVYVVSDLDRGDRMSNWSPAEALPEILGAQRTPLTLAEGIHWVLQQPEALARNQCFMTIGSRLHRDTGRLDARTPALWISNGTGRDGVANKNAPKVGWCWAGNRHTWLGFASTASRRPLGLSGD